jgi:monoamine oxidase
MARIASPTRRELLAAGATAGALALLPATVRGAAARPKVAIVGAGIAGLTAALTLRDAGIHATVYEASDRIGGRMHTSRDGWADGQHVELGGEFVDSDHTTIRGLAKRYDLALRDLDALEPRGSRDAVRIAGAAVSDGDLRAAFVPVAQALRRDVRAADSPQARRRLDHTSVHDWIAAHVRDDRLAALLDIAFTEEYGADTQDLSALNIVWDLVRRQPGDGFRLFASDERYVLAAGSQALPAAIARHVGVRLDRRVTGVAQHGRRVILGFDRGEVSADHVILALPFAVLRDLDLADAGFDARKRRAIDQLGRGRNTKVALQFDGRPWDGGAGNGTVYTDAPFTTSWDSTRGQRGSAAVLTTFSGGSRAAALARDERRVPATLAQLEQVFPRISARYNGHAVTSAPFEDPNLRCSYSYVGVGQFTTIHGYERVAQGRVHFAGEHCSLEYQGFMEGAAREGIRAAREVLAQTRV